MTNKTNKYIFALWNYTNKFYTLINITTMTTREITKILKSNLTKDAKKDALIEIGLSEKTEDVIIIQVLFVSLRRN